MRQRDANLTALAAIGPRKKRRLDAPGLLSIGGEVSVYPEPVKRNHSFRTSQEQLELLLSGRCHLQVHISSGSSACLVTVNTVSPFSCIFKCELPADN